VHPHTEGQSKSPCSNLYASVVSDQYSASLCTSVIKIHYNVSYYFHEIYEIDSLWEIVLIFCLRVLSPNILK
jgi:hypothetical protein